MHICDGWTEVVDLTHHFHHFQDIVIGNNGECPDNICVFGADDEGDLFACTGEAVDEWLSGFIQICRCNYCSVIIKKLPCRPWCLHGVVQDLRHFHHILYEDKSVVWQIRGINYDSLLGKKKMPKCWSLFHTVFEWRCIWGWTVVLDGACIYWKARLSLGAGGGDPL